MSAKTVKKSKADEICRIEGELTVGRATELVSVLNDTLDSLNRCVIDLGSVSEIDAAGIQVLCSLHRTAVGRNIPITLSVPLRGRPGFAAAEAGAPCVMRTREYSENCLLRMEVVHE